jgi:hypothetical protein
MKPMRQSFVLAALLSAGAVEAQPMQYAPRHIEKILPGCGDEKYGCYRIVFDSVEITGGVPAAVLERINQAIRDYLQSPEQYFAKYQDPRGAKWWLEKKVEVLRATPPVIGLRCFDSSYSGGAHPITNTTYLNFNASTGQKVQLSEILRDGAMPQLTRIAEVYFRWKRDIPLSEDLKAAGFIFFKNDRFALNDNFGIGEQSLFFTFNPYEVAPYYLGPTEFEIPFSAIHDLLRPGSGL